MRRFMNIFKVFSLEHDFLQGLLSDCFDILFYMPCSGAYLQNTIMVRYVKVYVDKFVINLIILSKEDSILNDLGKEKI